MVRRIGGVASLVEALTLLVEGGWWAAPCNPPCRATSAKAHCRVPSLRRTDWSDVSNAIRPTAPFVHRLHHEKDPDLVKVGKNWDTSKRHFRVVLCRPVNPQRIASDVPPYSVPESILSFETPVLLTGIQNLKGQDITNSRTIPSLDLLITTSAHDVHQAASPLGVVATH